MIGCVIAVGRILDGRVPVAPPVASDSPDPTPLTAASPAGTTKPVGPATSAGGTEASPRPTLRSAPPAAGATTLQSPPPPPDELVAPASALVGLDPGGPVEFIDQAIMRHSTVELTAKHYIDVPIIDTKGAVEKLAPPTLPERTQSAG